MTRGPNPAREAISSGPRRQFANNEKVVQLVDLVPKQSHYEGCPALRLLCNNWCGPRTKRFGDHWCRLFSKLAYVSQHFQTSSHGPKSIQLRIFLKFLTNCRGASCRAVYMFYCIFRINVCWSQLWTNSIFIPINSSLSNICQTKISIKSTHASAYNLKNARIKLTKWIGEHWRREID